MRWWRGSGLVMATTTGSDELGKQRKKRSAPRSPTSRGTTGRAHGKELASSREAAVAAFVSAEQAWSLKVQGKSLSEIAEALGIGWRDVDRLLVERYQHEAAFLTDVERK